jgi:prolyl-tRNA synthetase
VINTAGHPYLLLLRGDHALNEVKLGKHPAFSEGFRFASEQEVEEIMSCRAGYIGPVQAPSGVEIIADRSVAAMADFVCGANDNGQHLSGVNFVRDLPEPGLVTFAMPSKATPARTAKARWNCAAVSKSATSSNSATNIPNP